MSNDPKRNARTSTEPGKPATPGRSVVVTDADRLDRALVAVALAGSRTKAAEYLKAGRVLLDGDIVDISHASLPVAVGQTLTLVEPGQYNSKKALVARRILDAHGIQLIADGRGYIAIAKPAGLLTDAATFKQKRDEPNAADIVTEYLAARHGGETTALPAHRIDRDTSGVVLFAKDATSEAHLRDQFAARTPERVYLAALRGRVEGDSGTWEHVMRWDSDTNRQLPARAEDPGAVTASASWRVIGRIRGAATGTDSPGEATLVEVRLVTGRRNQIRLHAALVGHPLLGERMYRPPRYMATRPVPDNTPDIGRQALHAAALHITDPTDGSPLVFVAPPPEDFLKVLRWFRVRWPLAETT